MTDNTAQQRGDQYFKDKEVKQKDMEMQKIMQLLNKSAHKGEVIDLKTQYEFAIKARAGKISEEEKS